MSLSTNLVSGLSSGFDWRGMIDQLMEIEHQRVDLVENRKSEYEAKLAAWRSFNTKLLSLNGAVEGLRDPEDFYVYTSNMMSDDSDVDASDLLSVSTSSSASKGSYSITVSALATAQKLSSNSFSSYSDALGDSYAGEILVNGVVVSISDTDSLADVRDSINNANAGTNPSGVTASIVNYGINDYRLMLTSDNTGVEGIGLQNASASDLVELFGWKDQISSLKNSITGGAQSDSFTSSTQDVKTLLGLSTTQSGTIQIMDGDGVYQDVSIDLSSDSIEDIKTAINNAAITGVSASIVTDTSDSTTTYMLQIDGSQDFVDAQNILETLGIIHNGVSEVQGSTSGNSMTENGEYITSSSLITDIDGYNEFTSGDKVSLGATSTDHSGNDVSGDILTITENTTVQDLLDAIETAYEANGDEVSVSLTSTGKVEVSDLEDGASSLVVDLQSTIDDSYSSLDWGTFTTLDEVRKRELVEGSDASIEVDGIAITSSDNTLDDVIPGVTLNLLKADESTTITLNIDQDIGAVMDKISTFVDAYNDVIGYIHQQQAYDEEEEKTGGILFGDNTLSSVKSDLTSTLLNSVWGVSSDFSTLGLAGINLASFVSGEDYKGQLEIDNDTLRGYLETNFNDIKNLFSANGTTSEGTLEYISNSNDTQEGEYTVNITQAATQSSSTSDNAIGGTLGSDETLTITEGDKTATISLTSDMTVSDVINAINTELDTVYTETLVGSEALTASSNPITSSTTWESIDSANLADEDIITFTGSSRRGEFISGSYTISQASSDTVQGLLSAIESAFGNDVTAAIDSSGYITLTDKNSGNSDLSINFDYTDAHDLDFGTVLTTNAGGQEGRYTIEITASNDGSDYVVLAHDAYGSGNSFAVEEDTDAGLWTGSMTTPITVDNGVDVAGTINGEAATGSGQILKGDEDEANVDGLVIKYTGSDTGEVGDIKLTVGAAELFDRVLFNITDAYEGYVAFKQESLQGSIDSFDTQIEQMEARLDRKMERMINRFVAMEMALSQIQSQSQWLTGQINATYSGWV